MKFSFKSIQKRGDGECLQGHFGEKAASLLVVFQLIKHVTIPCGFEKVGQGIRSALKPEILTPEPT